MKIPVINLSFFLLLGSCSLNEPKPMNVAIPKDMKDTSAITEVNGKLAVIMLLDGNKEGKFYYYEGKLDSNTVLQEMTPDTGFRIYVQRRNRAIINDMNELRAEFKNVGADDTAFARRRDEIQMQHKDAAPFLP